MSRQSFQNPKVKERQSARGIEYYIRYRMNVIETKDGRPTRVRKDKHEALGLKSEMTLAQAKAAAAVIMKKINQTGSAQSEVLLSDFIPVYKEEHYRELKLTSQKSYTTRIAVNILPAMGHLKLCQIRTFEVTRMLGDMERAGVARETRLCTKAILTNIFKCARVWGFLDASAPNPVTDAAVGRSRGNEAVLWTPTIEEAERIIAACSDEVATLLWLIIWTGMRISEACGLRWKNVDLEKGCVYVRERNCGGSFDDPKSAQGNRALPLGNFAARLAPLRGDPEGLVITALGAAEETYFYTRVRTAMREVGLYHPRNLFHAFRRLNANLMRNLNLLALQKHLGHADLDTTRRYVSDDLRERADALQAVQDKVIPIRKKA